MIVAERCVAGLVSANPSRFKNRSEAELAGYTAAQDYLHHDDPGPLSVGLILHLHRLLFSFVDRTNTALDEGGIHPLLVVAAFGLDVLCLHPFADGNGRVTRLLTAHLMQRAGYGVGRYVAVEQLIFETKDDYYVTLAASTTGWFDDGAHSVWPWAGYFLDRIAQAYERFGDRVAAGTSVGTKQDRIGDYVLLHAPAQFAIADIRRAVPGVSDYTIRLVLTELKAAGNVTVDGTGRDATWSRTGLD